ncbi:MAG: hypothetical protein J5871_04450, partial [Bacteroidales bacterium]|nr:hypothetical protein [Bacteroidales bacterium]
MSQQSDHTGRDPVGFVLYVVYVLLLGASLLVLGRIVYIQTVWVPNEKIRTALVGKSSQARDLLPSRGNIYDCKGRLLAMSSPMYQFGIDCTVMKDAYALLGPEEQKQKEAEWDAKARALADALPAFFPEKTAAQYLEEFRSARRNGKKYLPLGKKKVDYYTRCSLLKLPLLSEAPTRGGRCEAREENRLYPYGKLARRTIGFVRSNRLQDVSNNHVGLEGKYNHELHGQEGVEWLRKTDAGHVHDYDKPFEMAVDGQHLHTTLDIDYQDLADGALRDLIADEQDLDGGCLVLMEVKTGAIRAMVNLSRTGSEAFDEVANIAIGRRQEPGSVFKTVTLMSVLSDGYVRRLDETIPTNHGWVSGTKIKQDTHIPDYERNHKTNRISIYDGFKMSSNYV